MLLTMKYRLYPSRVEEQRLLCAFETCRLVYNELVALSVDAYRFGGVVLGVFDYNAYLSGRDVGVHSQVLQNVSDRVAKAFKNFFRRLKDPSVKNKGFPRYKSRGSSMTYPQSGFRIEGKRLYCSTFGRVPIIMHRPVTGTVKTLTVKVNRAGQFFAFFTTHIPDPHVKHSCSERIGIDVGIENFAALSNGVRIPNPRFFATSLSRVVRAQRCLSRKKKGSRNFFEGGNGCWAATCSRGEPA
jgi:putative transposase